MSALLQPSCPGCGGYDYGPAGGKGTGFADLTSSIWQCRKCKTVFKLGEPRNPVGAPEGREG